MDQTQLDIESEWLVEIDRRAAASDSSDGKSIPFEEAWKQITKSLTPNQVDTLNENNRRRDPGAPGANGLSYR
jgi:hypothetical protein